MTQEKNRAVRVAIDNMLNERLKKFLHCELDKKMCLSIYQEIFSVIEEIITMIPQLGSVCDHDMINFIAQAYYDLIEVNGKPLIDNIFTQRVFAMQLSTQQLTVICPLFIGTPIVQEIVATIKKRS